MKCYVCGNGEFDETGDFIKSKEHIIPRSKGGKNRRYNYTISHRICNYLRGSDIYFFLLNKPTKEEAEKISLIKSIDKKRKIIENKILKVILLASNNLLYRKPQPPTPSVKRLNKSKKKVWRKMREVANPEIWATLTPYPVKPKKKGVRPNYNFGKVNIEFVEKMRKEYENF